MKQLAIIILYCISMNAAGQNRMMVSRNGNTMYITKIIEGPQSLSNLSDQYTVPLSVLAKINGLKINMELRKGDELKIPLNRDNFYQHHIYGKFQPVYYLTVTNETLGGIANMFYNVSVDSLKIWNNLIVDNLPINKAIVIGFVLNKKAIPVTAGYQAIAYDTIPNPNILDAFKFGAKELKGELKPKPLPIPSPPANLPIKILSTNNTINNSSIQITPKTENLVNAIPVNNKTFNTIQTLVQTESDYNYRAKPNDEGFFEHIYLAKVKDRAYQAITGDASIFKTISGWKDRKFYILINEVLPGTIVRVTAANKKSICAKVLGPLPETKGASGIFMRLSNAAASALGISDQKFIVSITYVEY